MLLVAGFFISSLPLQKAFQLFIMRNFIVLVLVLGLASCSTENKPSQLFESLSSTHTGINFINKVENTPAFNIFSYRNFYNGGGVAIGDINKDGWADVYMTNNMGKNQLYLNKGDFRFENSSASAGVEGTKAWSTGVVMVDINSDGWLDIYVCNAGYVKGDDQENELFINNQDGTFTERAAEYQLDENGFTTHAAFFDYDLDGDLDAYILNNSFLPVNTLNYENKRELRAENWEVKDFVKGGGDKLLRNDNGKFIDVSEEAGIYGSLIGFGLGITVGDINDDQLPDMYISNDFFERDYLYINQGDGTFKEDIKTWMEHISLSSMGADMADINNDGYPEIFVTEMLPDEEYRLKTTTLFENYNIYSLKLQRDFYHQYMQNTLQLNNKDQTFSEIAYYSGVAASDWSWGALMVDLDNDRYRDLYVCNGIYQDVTDQDFINFFANDIIQKMAMTGEKEELDKVIEKMPSNPQPNKVFKNRRDLTFEEVGEKWGFDVPSFSNGAAYGDLDNDGDLDLIINNLNQEAFVYRNNSEQLLNHHFISLQLKGEGQNTFAIGTNLFLYIGEEVLNFQVIPTRGFQSSIDYKVVFGLGNANKVDSLRILWPDKMRTTLENVPIDTTLLIDYQQVEKMPWQPNRTPQKQVNALFKAIPSPFEAHQEDNHIDFYQEGLVMRLLSREGPKAAKGDINGDGQMDVFIGGAKGQAGQLYVQNKNGWMLSNTAVFEKDALSEDTAAEFFDADGDGDLDLFVGSGGNHRPARSKVMQDRLYLNDGSGNFVLKTNAFDRNGYNTSVAVPLDFDEDGDLDLFVGSRSIPQNYGVPPQSFLYQNDGTGRFKNVTRQYAPILERIGMVTDAQLIDVLGDARSELVVVGEWMTPQVFTIEKGRLERVTTDLNTYSGWWYAVESDDVDGDGDQDLILGNRGENFYFTGTIEAPAKLWLWDFDQNGTIEKIITRNIDGKDMTVATKADLTNQVVSLKKQTLKNAEFAHKSIQDLFPAEALDKAVVRFGNWFKSAVAINQGNGAFQLRPLPKEVQFSCVCDISCVDLDGNGRKDLILGGNDMGFMPQFSKLDASFGHILLNKGNGEYERVENRESGFWLKGDVKQFLELDRNGQPHLLTLINNQKPHLFRLK